MKMAAERARAAQVVEVWTTRAGEPGGLKAKPTARLPVGRPAIRGEPQSQSDLKQDWFREGLASGEEVGQPRPDVRARLMEGHGNFFPLPQVARGPE